MDLKRYVHGYSVESLNTKNERYEPEHANTVSNKRRFLSQFIAASAINLILFDIGLALSYPTLVVAVLQAQHISSTDGISTEEIPGLNYNTSDITKNFSVIQTNSSSFGHEMFKDQFKHLSFFRHFTLNSHEISWYVSIAYICQPIGSILGGSVIGWMGRKRLMQALNIFMFAGWLLPFFSTGPAYMYLSNILLGIGIGCGESPIATYLGEITEVPVRGFILTLAQVYLSLSFLVPYLISLMVGSWRWLALVLSTVPILTFIVCSIVPETPAWLLSKQRYKEAEASLKWLRGWSSSEQVKEELEEISSHQLDSGKRAGSSNSALPVNSTDDLVGGQGVKETILYFLSARMRRPFIIVCVMFALLYITGMCTIRPYLVPLFQEMGITMDPDTAALWVTFAGAVGNLLSLCLVKLTGKRFIVFSALSGSAVCTLVIALIKAGVLPSGWSFFMFLGTSFFSGYGIVPLPWILQGELYPFRGRGFASGMGAAFSYLIGFIATKSYAELKEAISLQGVFAIFTCFSLMGLIYLWIRLPETEGKSFQEIDQYFDNLSKKKTDE